MAHSNSGQEKLGFVGFWIGAVGLLLSVLFYFFPLDTSPKGPPLTAVELEQAQAEAMSHMFAVRSAGTFAAIHSSKVKPLAEKFWSDKRYSEQAPDVVALTYRMYGAALALSPSKSGSFIAELDQAMPWLDRSMDLYNTKASKPKDFVQLNEAYAMLGDLLRSKPKQVDAAKLMTARLRLAMTEAPDSEVQRLVNDYITFMKTLISPRSGGYSPRDDLEYLKSYRVPAGFKLGDTLETFQSTLRSQFPNKEVGGNPVFLPLPNGNTKVIYLFFGKDDKKMEMEWEVSKEKSLIVPLNDQARSAMNLGAK